MTITFVGSNAAQQNSSFAFNLSLPAAIQNDLVVIFTACQDETKGGPPTTAGYTAISNVLHPSVDCRLHASYKFMGATPDTQVTLPSSGSTALAIVAIAMVFRGVNITPLDVTATTASGLAGDVDPPAITPTHDDCCVLVAGASPAIPGGAVGSITSYSVTTSQKSTAVTVETGKITIASCYRVLVGRVGVSENPAKWSNWIGDFVTLTIALRPITTTTDFVTVDKASITITSKTVVLLETTPVSKSSIVTTGKIITTPDARVESIFVDAADITRVGQSVEPTDIIRGIDITKASVLVRGRTVTVRDIQFEDIPRYAMRGRGSGHWMETR